jgi:two-component system, NarL family, response regulator NreC
MSALRLADSSPDPEIRVLLADDHRDVWRNLRLLLTGEAGIAVVADPCDLHNALRHITDHAPHVLLLDLRIPSGSRIEAIRRLHAAAPETAIVVVTMDDNPLFARQALEAGAVGYVLGENVDAELAHAVRCAARGEQYVCPRAAGRLDALRAAVEEDHLTPREIEVLRLIALGLTSNEISVELHLSRRTVDAHRRRIHQKLGLAKRSELVRYAMGHSLVGTADSS